MFCTSMIIGVDARMSKSIYETLHFSATEFKRGIEKSQCHHFAICKSCGFSKITEPVAKKLGLAGLKRWLLAQIAIIGFLKNLPCLCLHHITFFSKMYF